MVPRASGIGRLASRLMNLGTVYIGLKLLIQIQQGIEALMEIKPAGALTRRMAVWWVLR